jgi:erythromycin esterase-like protein
MTEVRSLNDVSVVEAVKAAAEPLPEIDDAAFGRMFDRFADARIVLLGEASHGTSEFYRARAAITRRLIEERGFTIVAVEADWPDAASIDRHVRHKPALANAAPAFQRFPTWMWRNTDVDAFVDWLRGHNRELGGQAQTGFYGLDLYNLAGSIRAVIDYLDRVNPDAAAIARERYGCLTPFEQDPATYGRMAISEGYARCEKAVVEMLAGLFRKSRDHASIEDDDFLDAAQNARLVANAEAYYRALYYGAAESWNLRDEHMFDTLDLLLKAKGDDAKAVVWAHNSHIGDARFTDMGRNRDELNLGQLCREGYGHEACLIGFGTHTGTVAAATDWDGPMEVKQVNRSRPDSYERIAHDTGIDRFLLDLREKADGDGRVREALMEERLERFIGVIYRPDTERWSHYSEATLPQQFDAFVWFDETSAVTPLAGPQRKGGEETYPFGL